MKHACLRGLGLTVAEMDSILHQVCKGHTETTQPTSADEKNERLRRAAKSAEYLFMFIYL